MCQEISKLAARSVNKYRGTGAEKCSATTCVDLAERLLRPREGVVEDESGICMDSNMTSILGTRV